MSFQVRFPDLYLEVNDLPLSTAAWEVVNLHVLMSGPATRGENIVIPGASGVRPKPKRATERTYSLQLYVWGETDPAGAVYPDPVAGLFANVALLRELTAPRSAPLDAMLHHPGGVMVAAVQFASFEIGDNMGPTTLAATVDMVVLAGAFT